MVSTQMLCRGDRRLARRRAYRNGRRLRSGRDERRGALRPPRSMSAGCGRGSSAQGCSRSGLDGVQRPWPRVRGLSRGLSALPPLAIDMALPSLALVQADLGASQATTAASIAIFLAGFSTAPLLVGPLADRFGRKPVMLAGLALFTLVRPRLRARALDWRAARLPPCSGRRRRRGRHAAARDHPRPVRRAASRAFILPRSRWCSASRR